MLRGAKRKFEHKIWTREGEGEREREKMKIMILVKILEIRKFWIKIP